MYSADGESTATWVGFQNYVKLWDDPNFWTSLRNNIAWLILYMLAVPLGLFIALYLNQTVTGMRFYKSMFFFPFVISQVVVGLIFGWFYNPDFGVVGTLWKALFCEETVNIVGNVTYTCSRSAPDILSSPEWATYGIIAAGLWPQIAYCMILYLTGLNNVAADQIEAARLDGAKGWKMLWYVVLPQLKPATFHCGRRHGHRRAALFRHDCDHDSGRPVWLHQRVVLLHVRGRHFGIWRTLWLWLVRGHGPVPDHAVFHQLLPVAHVPRREGRPLMFPRPIEKSTPTARFAYQAFLPFALILWLLPLIAILLTSIRSAKDINSGNVFGWPSEFALIENYTAVFTQSAAAQYMMNSVLITVPTVIISVALACLAGYALAIYRFRVALPLFFLFVAGNFIPFQILMVPVRDMSVQTGLYDTIAGQFLFHAAFQTGFCTLFMRNFIKALPFDLIESARIEGVAEWKIFWYVVLPLVRPAIAALAVLIFTFVWNDFFWANVLTQGEAAKPITAGVRALNGQFVNNWHLVSAASLLAAVPPVAMFFLMQRHFIAGLTLGAVK